MSKLKVSNKKGNGIKVTQKISKKELVNEYDIAVLERENIPGLFVPQILKKGKIEYFARATISLKEYIKKGVSKHKIYSIVAKTVEIMKTAEEYGFYLPNIVLDESYIFVQEITGDLYFIYQPIMGKDYANQLFSFLIRMLSKIKTEDKQLTKESQSIIMYLQKPDKVKLGDIEAYLEKNYPQIYQELSKRKTIESDGFTKPEKVVPIFEETSVLMQEEKIQARAYLIRKKNRQKYEIQKNECLIGKASDCDIVIADNVAVSRQHARIYDNCGVYFVVDEESKNHTYLNGQMVYSTAGQRLSNQDIITIANDDFQFFVE